MSVQSVIRKRPIVAVVLSFIICGLGQAYGGRFWRGLSFFVLWIVCWIVFAATSGIGVLQVAGFLVGIGVWLFGMIDAFQLAQRPASRIAYSPLGSIARTVSTKVPLRNPRVSAANVAGNVRGDLGLRLRKAVATGGIDSVAQLLQERLPPWPTSALVIKASRELLQLITTIATAQRAGVPKGWIQQFTKETNNTLAALWQLAGRLAAVKDEHVAYDALAAKLAKDEHWLKGVVAAATQARTGLVELTLWGERVGERPNADLHTAQIGLQALANAARDS